MFDGLLALFLRSIAVKTIKTIAVAAAIANVASADKANSGLRFVGVAVGL